MSLKDVRYDNVEKKFRARYAVLYSIVTHVKQNIGYGSLDPQLIHHSDIILIISEQDRQNQLWYGSQAQHRHA